MHRKHLRLGTAIMFACCLLTGGANLFAIVGEDWTEATPSADWSKRLAHAAISFDGKMWVLGGANDIGALSDVWFSTDGENWEAATMNAGWLPRFQHASTVFDGKMWVMGGSAGAAIALMISGTLRMALPGQR